MPVFIKTLFLISPVICYSNTPSFSFSKEGGLRQISSPLKTETSENQKDSPISFVEMTEEASVNETKAKQSDSLNKPLEITTEKSDTLNETPEETPIHTISEDFAPKEKEQTEGSYFLDTLMEDSSWFFQDKHSAHKIGITPLYGFDRIQGHRLGLSFFSYSPKEKGYYFNSSVSKYLSGSFYRFSMSFIGNREGLFRSKGALIYDNQYENFYGDTKYPEAMLAKKSDQTKIYPHRFIVNYDLFYQEKDQDFYFGLGAKVFFRKERPSLQENKTYFKSEAFLFLRAFAGFDTRDNWKDPKKGAFHQASFGCKAILAYPESYCQGEGDARFYLSLFKDTDFPFLKDSILALRAFAGFSFLSDSSYATKYSLGGHSFFQGVNTLRGFKKNRFLGDKIYFTQTELRFPIWNKYLQGVVFLELGEVAESNQFFKDFALDYGGGLRFGLPPKYDMKLRLDYGTGRDLQGVRNYDINISILQYF
ncbi:MAG: hypothetical protein OXN83_05685 [Oligoflexia bacterium]|nr:hypothetical protein [Oligoflexia bacterium]